MKGISKILACFLLVIIIVTTMGYCIKNKVYGATYTTYDIDGIDESKYPGYKAAIKKLQVSHPNWTFKLCYTGLDWNKVINNEYTGHGGTPKSLVYDTYDGEWICEICGTKKYDLTARWYCASKEAIKYMMDPRNSLTESYVFQFQDLSSSVGDRKAVKKVTEGSFLYNDSYIDAIMTAAKKNDVSPFHIVSRIIQEQGKNGGNNIYVKGYEYNGKLVYNLFNIGATGSYGEYESGARKAYEEGWFSVESSIIGGTKFIKENYINRGQVSLYFQKYNVVEAGNLYNHQYMQNIGAPRSEAIITYDSYVKNDIQESSFEFIIPIYENMPEYASYCPNGSYMGNISTNVTTMNLIESNGHKYISGDIEITEWINDTAYTPKELPQLYLKSEDGTFSKAMYRYYKQGVTYYYDTIVDTLDVTRNYYIQAELTSSRNAGTTEMKIQKVNFEDKTLGDCGTGKIRAEDNTIKFNYKGIINTQLEQINMNDNGAGRHYISGNIQISEVIGGKNEISSTLPNLMLKTIAGYQQKMYVYHSGNGKYYFDTYVEDLDKMEQYYIEAKLTDSNNLASEEEKTKQVELPEKPLGKIKEYKVYIKDNMLQFVDVNLYKGTIKTRLSNISMQANNEGKHYIYGNIQISETIDGIEKVPSILPELLLKTENLVYSQKMYIYHSGNGNYYFDTYIENLNLEEEYYIEARLINEKNIAEERNKIQKVTIKDQELGKMKDKKVVFKDSKLQFVDADKYVGIIKTKLEGIYLNDNGAGKYYISGNLRIIEEIENVASVAETLPDLLLKTQDGYSKKMYIYHSGNGNYYFDTYIEDLDLDKKYFIEATLTDTKNIAETSEKTQKVTILSKELGKARERKVVIANNMLQFIELDKYQASIYTKLEGLYLNDNGAGRHYISGNIQIKQIEDGKTSICPTLPQLLLKDGNGYEQKMYIYHSGNGNYYFDTYIEELDTTQDYYIEASLTDINNNIEESEKTQVVTIENKGLGKFKQDSILVRFENNKLTFEEINIIEKKQEEEI